MSRRSQAARTGKLSGFPVTPARRKLLAQVHIAKKDMGLDDALYREMIGMVAPGCSSASQLSDVYLRRLITHFKDKGWQNKSKPKTLRKGYRPTAHRPMVRKIYVLWGILYRGGSVRVSRPDGYIKRMTKTDRRPDGISAPEFLEDDEAWKVIEALKSWIYRDGLERELHE